MKINTNKYITRYTVRYNKWSLSTGVTSFQMNYHTLGRCSDIRPLSHQYKSDYIHSSHLNTEVRMLSKPIRSSRSSVPSHQLNDMHSAEEHPLAAKSATMHPLHSKLSRSQPTLIRIDHTDVRASAFFSDYPQRTPEVAYPSSLIKHSYEDLLSDHGPIPVEIPLVPSMPHRQTCTSNSPSRDTMIPPAAAVSPTPAPNSLQMRERLSSYDNAPHSVAYDQQSSLSHSAINSQIPCSRSNIDPSLHVQVNSPRTHNGEQLSAASMPTSAYNSTTQPFSRHIVRHSIATPIPIEIPKVPSSKRVSIHDPYLYSAIAPHDNQVTRNITDSNTTSMHSNVSNILPADLKSATGNQQSEVYRGRSHSHGTSSGVQPSSLPFRPRSVSETYRPGLAQSTDTVKISSRARLYEQSSSSEDEVEEDSPFTVPPSKPRSVEISTTANADSRKKSDPFAIDRKPRSRSTILSAHLSTSMSLPTKVRIVKGTLYPSGGVAITRGHDLLLHFVKHTSAYKVQAPDGAKYTIPFNSSIRFAVLYNPTNPVKPIPKGFKFRSAGDIMKLKSIPLVVAVTKSFEGVNSKSTVREGQILLIRGIKTDSASGYRLMVKTINGHKKLLPPKCVAHFSTAPNLISLTVQEFIKCKIKMPQNVVLQYPTSVHRNKSLPAVVTMLEPTKEVSVIASCPTLNDTPNTKLLEIPLSTSVIVQELEENNNQLKVLTEKLYHSFDACVTSYCSDSLKLTAQEVQSTFLKCLSSSERTLGWELVRLTDVISEEKSNPLLATPLSTETALDSYRFSNYDTTDGPTSSSPDQQLPDSDRDKSSVEPYHAEFDWPAANNNPLSQPAYSPDLPKDVTATYSQPMHTEPEVTSQSTPPTVSMANDSFSEHSNASPDSLKSGLAEIESTTSSGSHSNELMEQIQYLEAKCSSTDKQLSEFSRQFNEVKSVLTNLQQSMSSSDANTTETVQVKHALSVCEAQHEVIHSTEGKIGTTTHSQVSKVLTPDSQKKVPDRQQKAFNGELSYEESSSDVSKKRGYFGKRLNQARARFGKLLSRRQLAPISPPATTTPEATFHCLKPIPEMSEAGDSNSTASYTTVPNQKQTAATCANKLSTLNNIATDHPRTTQKPPILPKPPSLKTFEQSKPVEPAGKKLSAPDKGDHRSAFEGGQRDPLARPVDARLGGEDIRNHASGTQHRETMLPSRSSPPPEQQVSNSNNDLAARQVTQKPPLAPKPKVKSKTTPSTKGASSAENINQCSTSKKNSLNQVSTQSSSNETKPSDSIKETAHTSQESKVTTPQEEEDEIAALVEDITAWCSQIETEVSQLVLMQAED